MNKNNAKNLTAMAAMRARCKGKDTEAPPQKEGVLHVFTDGSRDYSWLNGAGWAFIIVRKDDEGNETTEEHSGSPGVMGGGSAKEGGRAMELMAIKNALKAIPKDAKANVYTDYANIIKEIRATKRGYPLTKEAEEILCMLAERPGVHMICPRWIKSNPHHERAHFLANLARTRTSRRRVFDLIKKPKALLKNATQEEAAQ